MAERDPRVAGLASTCPRLFQRSDGGLWLLIADGWMPIVQRLLSAIDSALTDEQAAAFRVEYIKEKWAELQFTYSVEAEPLPEYHPEYESVSTMWGRVKATRTRGLLVSFPLAEVDALVSEAVNESRATCERCGAPGVLRTSGMWRHVGCERCELIRNR